VTVGDAGNERTNQPSMGMQTLQSVLHTVALFSADGQVIQIDALGQCTSVEETLWKSSENLFGISSVLFRHLVVLTFTSHILTIRDSNKYASFSGLAATGAAGSERQLATQMQTSPTAFKTTRIATT
jgi:hypothetical protein